MIVKNAIVLLVAILVFGCAEIEPKPFEPSAGHITAEPATPAVEAGKSEIPELVQKAPVLPEPEAPRELEKYTVVVNEVPVKELLFALARDAKLNVDIDPAINGVVTINAVDQTLPQILERIARQVDMRYEFDNDNLLIQPDKPYFKVYRVNYINLSRETLNTNTVATSLATTSIAAGGGGGSSGGGGGGSSGGGGAFGGNNSTTELNSETLNKFWSALTTNILAILGEDVSKSGESQKVVANPETGLITVQATASQHKQIQQLIDQVMDNVRRQVLIQISIVEVNLSDEYQAGIDWSTLELGGGFNIVSSTLGATFGAKAAAGISQATGLVIDYEDSDNKATIQFLEEFGDVKVLSSPQLMALNNQTAILKRVENRVFFTVEGNTASSLGVTTQSFDTTIHQLPVGIVMTITPHIAENGEIMLLVRPTISREIGEGKTIPLPDTVANDLPDNRVPETVTQEMESLIRLNSGQVAILGGLMEDRANITDRGLPGTSRLGIIGNLFKTRDKLYSKTETVIFIRPLIINEPNINTDLRLYKPFLESSTSTTTPRSN